MKEIIEIDFLIVHGVLLHGFLFIPPQKKKNIVPPPEKHTLFFVISRIGKSIVINIVQSLIGRRRKSTRTGTLQGQPSSVQRG